MEKYVEKLIRNTDISNNPKVALEDSFSAKKCEFVKMQYKDSSVESETYVLRKVVSYIKKQHII